MGAIGVLRRLRSLCCSLCEESALSRNPQSALDRNNDEAIRMSGGTDVLVGRGSHAEDCLTASGCRDGIATYSVCSTALFMAVRPFSKSAPTIWSMFMKRQNALLMKLFLPLIDQVTRV